MNRGTSPCASVSIFILLVLCTETSVRSQNSAACSAVPGKDGSFVKGQSTINLYFANTIPSIIPNSDSLNQAFNAGAQAATQRWSEARSQAGDVKSFANPILNDEATGNPDVDIPPLFRARSGVPIGPHAAGNPCTSGWTYFPHAQTVTTEFDGVEFNTIQVYAQNGCALVDRPTGQILDSAFHDTFAATSPYIIPENIENMYAHEMGTNDSAPAVCESRTPNSEATHETQVQYSSCSLSYLVVLRRH